LDTGVEVDSYSNTLKLGKDASSVKTLAAATCIKNECSAILSGEDHTVSFVNIPGKICGIFD
jgi:hypothetical protein